MHRFFFFSFSATKTGKVLVAQYGNNARLKVRNAIMVVRDFFSSAMEISEDTPLTVSIAVRVKGRGRGKVFSGQSEASGGGFFADLCLNVL